jgi:hypothetical protein
MKPCSVTAPHESGQNIRIARSDSNLTKFGQAPKFANRMPKSVMFTHPLSSTSAAGS